MAIPPDPGRPARSRPGSGVTLSEHDGVRYLHFGSRWIQGAMRIAKPDVLELEYQQQMMAPLLLLPRPRRILQLGLGAAALTRFCLRHLPRAQVTVVEIDSQVVRVAERYFRLKPSKRLRVVVEDALDHLARGADRVAYDWLQVDIYDAAARGPVHDDVEFYRSCRAALAAPAVAAFNLFGSRFAPSRQAIDEAFDGRTLALPATEAGNRIVLALNGPSLDAAYAELEQRAAEVEIGFDLPASAWVTALRRGSATDWHDVR